MNVLEKGGIVRSWREGNRMQYEGNPDCAHFDEFRGIAKKTFGIADPPWVALHDLEIEIAFIFGSVARDQEKAHSDVDVLVIGATPYRDLLNDIRPIEERIGRAISVKLYRPDVFRDGITSGNAFLKRLTTDSRIFLIGDEHGFEACKSH